MELVHRLSVQSFGEDSPAFLLSLPLISTARTVGLLLVKFDGEISTDPILKQAVSFSAQAGGLLRNHEVLRRSRDRAAAHGALSQAARELFLTLDSTALYQTAVRHALVVADTPIAYLLMAEAGSDQLSLRASAGIASEVFASLDAESLNLLPLDQPDSEIASSIDYLSDRRFSLRPVVDRAIRVEGLRGLLAAPVRSNQRLIGMLYAADRKPRSFSSSAADAFAHLARDAALALGNAFLYEEVAATLRALTVNGQALRAENERLLRVIAEGTPPRSKAEPLTVEPSPRAETPADVPITAIQPQAPTSPEAQVAAAISSDAPVAPSPVTNRDLFAELLAESLTAGGADRNGAPPLGKPYRLLVVAADEQRSVAHRSRTPAPPAVRAQLAAILEAQPWCRSATDQEGNVVALVETDLADPSSVIGDVLGAQQNSSIGVRAALAPPCKALDQYRSSYASCRRTLAFLANVGGPRVVEIWKTDTYTTSRSGGASASS
jgi:GAF domain-containing protein